MFEAQVAYYLNLYLGKYVYGLDADSLKISVWRGDVELRNLTLRPEALEELDLPITVKAGLLGKLTLKVGALAGHALPQRGGRGHGDPARTCGGRWERCSRATCRGHTPLMTDGPVGGPTD